MSREKQYRPNVAAVIVSSKYPQKKEIFIAQRKDFTDSWQFPQGGIKNGEDVKEALFRELEEEIGTNKIEIITEYPDWLTYDFPDEIKKVKPWLGQRQKYFLVRLQEDAVINVETQNPEFSDYKFIKVDEIFKLCVGFKQDIYHKVIKYFQEEKLL